MKIKKRYLIETENADYWCSDYKFDPVIGIRTIDTLKVGKKTRHHMAHILYPTAIHDFDSEISLKEFKMRKENEERMAKDYMMELQKIHKDKEEGSKLDASVV